MYGGCLLCPLYPLLVAYHFLFTMYSNLACVTDLTFEFILHLYSFFVLFYLPVEGLCCKPKYWANIIHRLDDQNSLTSKCIEHWLYLKDLRKLTDSQRSALSVCPRGPRGCAQPQVPESQLFFVQFKDAYISTFQRPDSH